MQILVRKEDTIIKEKDLGKTYFRLKNIFVGQGIYFGDFIDGSHMEEVNRTNTRLFIKTEKIGEHYFLDPTHPSTKFKSIDNTKNLEDFFFDAPEFLTKEQIKTLCKKLNGTWLDIKGKITFDQAMKGCVLERSL